MGIGIWTAHGVQQGRAKRSDAYVEQPTVRHSVNGGLFVECVPDSEEVIEDHKQHQGHPCMLPEACELICGHESADAVSYDVQVLLGQVQRMALGSTGSVQKVGHETRGCDQTKNVDRVCHYRNYDGVEQEQVDPKD